MSVCLCSASLSPSEWASHQRRYHHAFQDGYACLECAFRSPHFGDATSHCLLHGHRLESQIVQTKAWDAVVRQASAALMPGEKRASDIAPSQIVDTEEHCEPTARSVQSEPTVQSQAFEPTLPSENSEPIRTAQSLSNMKPSDNTAQANDDNAPITAKEKRDKNRHTLQSITCKRCHSVIKCSGYSLLAKAAKHVHSCLRIRPFGCSKCGHQASRAWDMRYHISRKCPGATVEVLNKEECESALRSGLDWCFPGLNAKAAGGGQNEKSK